MKAIRSVLPHATYEEWCKTLVAFIEHQPKREQNH